MTGFDLTILQSITYKLFVQQSHLKEKITVGELDAVMALPTKSSSLNDEPKDVSICYIMMVSRRNNFLPFLIPCLGKLNKAGTAIKGFNRFLSGRKGK